MKNNMVLVACEESQAVTIEFRKLGFEAYSCDIQECSGGHPEWHIQGDVIPILDDNWDLVIAHPPCTHLAVSGARHFKEKIADGRMKQGIDLFMKFTECSAYRLAIENPVGIMSTIWRKPEQIIQPWEFGDSYQKSTCLWLRNLPGLKPTNIVEHGEFFEWFDEKRGVMKKQPLWFYMAKRQKNTGALRSKTFPGIAKAMAEQWGKVLIDGYYEGEQINIFEV